MTLNIDFQVGDKVTWKVGKVVSRGCFLEHNENGNCTVITHLVAGRVDNREVEVVKDLLKLDI